MDGFNYWGSAEGQIDLQMLNATSNGIKLNGASVGGNNRGRKQGMDPADQQVKKTTENIKRSTQMANGFLKGMAEASSRSATAMRSSFASFFSYLDREFKKKRTTDEPMLDPDKIKKKMKKPSKQDQDPYGFLNAGAGVGSEKLVEALSALAKEALPMITIMGSLSGIMIGVFNSMMGIGNATKDFTIALGGNFGEMNKLKNNMGNLYEITRLSDDQLISLAHSFVAAGVPVTHLSTDMTDYLAVAGKAVRMFQLSDDVAAEYTRTLKQSGMTFQEIDKDYDRIYKTMQSLGASVQDANASITDGIQLWKQYGATTGKSLKDFQSGVLGSRTLFKALNMDAKEAAGAMNDVYSDVGKKLQQAAFISAQTGMSGDHAYRMLGGDSGEAVGLRGQTALSILAKQMGSFSNTLGMTQAQKAGMSDKDARGADMARQYGLQNLQGMGFNASTTEGFLNAFEAKMNKQGGMKGSLEEEIAKFVPDLKKDAGMDQATNIKSMAEGMAGLNSTLPETLDRLKHEILGAFREIGNFLSDKLPALIATTNKLIDVGRAIWGVSAKLVDWGTTTVTNALNTIMQHMGVSPAEISAALDKAPAAIKNGDMGRAISANAPQGIGGIFGDGIRNLMNPKGMFDWNKQVTRAGERNGRAGTSDSKQWVDVGGGNKLSPEVAAAYLSARDEAKKHGVDFQVNSAGRDNAKQQQLYNQLHGKSPVALPGHSDHNFGAALDIQNYTAAEPYLKQFGFNHGNANGAPLAGDPWHFSFAAKAKAAKFTGVVPPPPPMISSGVPAGYLPELPTSNGPGPMTPELMKILEKANTNLENIHGAQKQSLKNGDKHLEAMRRSSGMNDSSSAMQLGIVGDGLA